MGNEIKYAPSYDAKAPVIKDIVGSSKMIRVYPYELPNTNKSLSFIRNNTDTIAFITQAQLTNEMLEVDENNNKYFEMLAAVTSNGVLDLSLELVGLASQLKQEDVFNALANYYYQTEMENIQIGKLSFMPAIFTIGKPFDKDEYEQGEQPVFMCPSMIAAKESSTAKDVRIVDAEGLYDFTLVNVTSIEAQATNARLFFTRYNTYANAWINSAGEAGFDVQLDNHMLLNYIKAKGVGEEVVRNKSRPFFDDVDLTTQSMTPFKFTPVYNNEKYTFFADWFDYDAVMPWYMIEIYNKNPGGDTLDKIIVDEDDRKCLEDMLLISAAFSTSFGEAPRYENGAEAGKIKGDFKIGWLGMKAQALEGKDPIKVVDGIFETHIRRHPAFLETPERFQPFRAMLAALSRFLYTSYAIGKGANSFNQLYLPWFLKPSSTTPITWNSSTTNVPNYEPGGGGDVPSYVLKTGFKVVGYSNYFRAEHTSTMDIISSREMMLPKIMHLSTIKMEHTERRIALPEIADQIDVIDKLPLPGDINTASDKDLKHIFYLPIKDFDLAKKLFLDTKDELVTLPAGSIVDYLINAGRGGQGIDGDVWTQERANAEVLKNIPGDLVVPPEISYVKGGEYAFQMRVREVDDSFAYSHDEFDIYLDGQWHNNVKGLVWEYNQQNDSKFVTKESLSKVISQILGVQGGGVIMGQEWCYGYATKGIYNDIREGDLKTIVPSPTYYKPRAEFTTAKVQIKAPLQTLRMNYTNRQVLFDKQQWKKFLSSFGFVTGINTSFPVTIENTDQIKYISEISIGSCWGDNISIIFNNVEIVTIPMLNASNESIGVQRLLFT